MLIGLVSAWSGAQPINPGARRLTGGDSIRPQKVHPAGRRSVEDIQVRHPSSFLRLVHFVVRWTYCFFSSTTLSFSSFTVISFAEILAIVTLFDFCSSPSFMVTVSVSPTSL